jgi:RHS repeat-associated protein
LAKEQDYKGATLLTETHFVRIGPYVIQEQNTSNVVTRAYVWGLDVGGGIGGLLELKNQSGSCYSYLYDGKCNVSAVIDSTQAVAATYTYDPYGKRMGITGTLDQPYQFSTKPYLPTLGVNYSGQRFYSPYLGRWINRDPIGEAGGMNMYAAMSNNPVNNVDPLGLDDGADFEVIIYPGDDSGGGGGYSDDGGWYGGGGYYYGGGGGGGGSNPVRGPMPNMQYYSSSNAFGNAFSKALSLTSGTMGVAGFLKEVPRLTNPRIALISCIGVTSTKLSIASIFMGEKGEKAGLALDSTSLIADAVVTGGIAFSRASWFMRGNAVFGSFSLGFGAGTYLYNHGYSNAIGLDNVLQTDFEFYLK